jgi:DNA-binding beta-propeller fold protein YncE
MRVKFTPDGKRALVSCASLNFINVFDVETRKSIDIVATKPVPVGISITPDGGRAFVACNGEPSVTVIDLEKLEAVESFEIGKYPFEVLYVEAKGRR